MHIKGVSCLYNHSMYAPPPHGTTPPRTPTSNPTPPFTSSNARQASVNSHLYNLYSETPKEGGHPQRRRPSTRESPPKGVGPRQRTRAAVSPKWLVYSSEKDASNKKSKNNPHSYPPPSHAITRKHICYAYRFDATKGFPGEGPPVKIVTYNINGAKTKLSTTLMVVKIGLASRTDEDK
eukprot:scaffold7713_cov100-Isochrysis_galbana.AAC.6